MFTTVVSGVFLSEPEFISERWGRVPKTVPKTEIPAGEVRSIEVDGTVVCVCNVDGQFYAFDGTCPHAGGPLGDGFLDGRTLTCPWHGWQFDVTSGACTFSPDIVQDRYVVTVYDDSIEIASTLGPGT